MKTKVLIDSCLFKGDQVNTSLPVILERVSNGRGREGGSRGSVCFVETQNIHTYINLESLHRNYYTNDAEIHCSK